MNQKLFHPPQHLKQYIRYYCVIDYTNVGNSIQMLDVYADVYPRMVIQHSEGNSGFFNKDEVMPISYISGVKTSPIHFSMSSSSIVIISFYPDALKILFGVDANELINLHPELDNFAPKSLTNLILETPSSFGKIELLNSFFTKKLMNSKTRFNTDFVNALSCFYSNNNENNVSLFLKENRISERQLERNFKANVGITPKQFLRIMRFEKSLSVLKNNKKSLGDLAFIMEYFDESHFIREFKEFTGITPNKFRNKNIISGESNAVLIKNS
jgi:AraC-like DNA-binding protein